MVDTKKALWRCFQEHSSVRDGVQTRRMTRSGFTAALRALEHERLCWPLDTADADLLFTAGVKDGAGDGRSITWTSFLHVVSRHALMPDALRDRAQTAADDRQFHQLFGSPRQRAGSSDPQPQSPHNIPPPTPQQREDDRPAPAMGTVQQRLLASAPAQRIEVPSRADFAGPSGPGGPPGPLRRPPAAPAATQQFHASGENTANHATVAPPSAARIPHADEHRRAVPSPKHAAKPARAVGPHAIDTPRQASPPRRPKSPSATLSAPDGARQWVAGMADARRGAPFHTQPRGALHHPSDAPVPPNLRSPSASTNPSHRSSRTASRSGSVAHTHHPMPSVDEAVPLTAPPRRDATPRELFRADAAPNAQRTAPPAARPAAPAEVTSAGDEAAAVAASPLATPAACSAPVAPLHSAAVNLAGSVDRARWACRERLASSERGAPRAVLAADAASASPPQQAVASPQNVEARAAQRAVASPQRPAASSPYSVRKHAAQIVAAHYERHLDPTRHVDWSRRAVQPATHASQRRDVQAPDRRCERPLERVPPRVEAAPPRFEPEAESDPPSGATSRSSSCSQRPPAPRSRSTRRAPSPVTPSTRAVVHVVGASRIVRMEPAATSPATGVRVHKVPSSRPEPRRHVVAR